MSGVMKLSDRNRAIQDMMTDSDGIRNFYRFVAQNPHINLHDACQIIITRQNAGICFSFEEWNALGRRVTKGRKGIPYYDNDGNKQFVFDVSDTHGDSRYRRAISPIRKLLDGLDLLNGTELADSGRGDYRILLSGVINYLNQNDYLSEYDEDRNRLIAEGVTYSLYCKTGFPNDYGIRLKGYHYSLTENAELFKEIQRNVYTLEQEIEDAITNKANEVPVIDDTEEDFISDEPVIEEVKERNIVEIHSAAYSRYDGYNVLLRHSDTSIPNSPVKVYLGKRENYDNKGNYDNTDNSLLFVSDRSTMFDFLSNSAGWVLSQEQMVKDGIFTEEDYKAYYELKEEVLKDYPKISEPMFAVDTAKKGSGTPFRYPDWKDKPKHPLNKIYQRYIDAQEKYPNAIVLIRLGDFYEVFGDNAETVKEELDLMITSRDFGLDERVAMCGFPQHKTDIYLEKLLEKHGVLVLEPDKEPMYILSHQEALALDNKESVSDSFEELEDVKADVFENEEQKENTVSEKPNNSSPIKDRKNKPSTQISLFDFEEKEQTPKEKLIEWGLKRGSGFQHGKYRIYEKYLTNPDTKEFAAFLKKEYGIGGGGYENEYWSDGKGLKLRQRDFENPDNTIDVLLSWTQVANGIADLIDDNNYLTADEEDYYPTYQAEEIEKARQLEAERKEKEDFIRFVLRSAPEDRKERISNEFEDTESITELADFLSVEYGTGEEKNEIYTASYNPQGFWISKPTKSKFDRWVAFCNWEEIAEKIKSCIEDGTYLEEPYLTPALEDEEDLKAVISELSETSEEEQPLNTDLTAIGFDQNELGGAKARFRNNIEAIKLVNRLYKENREATDEERKILSKYVGWGGLAQAFDERNESWHKEFTELKETLDATDYVTAKASVLNAHYTSKEVIDGIYTALSRFGVKGNNRILEPALGTGNFFGFMPKEISEGAKLYGVELDNITGRIASKLYPGAKVQIKGFEETTFPNNHFDLMVSNVPFGGYTVFDSEYNRLNFYIHDYFIAKGIDKIKPNGLMAVVTSKGTMDKLNPSVRKYIADRAELLGAVRLPNTAFKKTANTEVVTDILFFKKREEKIYADTENTEWLSIGTTDEGYEINNYYLSHPEMILGTLEKEHGLYGAEDITVKPDGRKLLDALNEATERLPRDFYINPEYSAEEEKDAGIEVDYDIKPMNLKAVGGKVYMRVGESMVEQTVPNFPKDAYERIAGMIDLRTHLRYILDIQVEGCSDDILKEEQRKLNERYDRFVKKYGNINSKTNLRLFKDDGDSALLFACENVGEDEVTITKSDIFSKRTIRPYTSVTSTDDPFEALQISKNEHGCVDISYIEELTKKDYDTVLSELGNAVFRNPRKADPEDKYSGFETAEEYLSGKVVEKLETAKRYKEEYPDLIDYDKNISALTEVQPTPIKASDISVRIGTSWIDKEYYKEFFCELIRMPYYMRDGIELYYNRHDSSWKLERTSKYASNYRPFEATNVYGTSRANAYRLFEDCLNQKFTQVYDTIIEPDGREKRVLNQSETIAAREKQNKIKEAFKDWIFKSPERRDELEATYNRLFNQIRLPKYDGSYLRFPEMSPAIELRPHQKDAVHRIITSGNTLLHHVVGSGKTFTMCAAAMKLRQYGLAKKPMIVVPNHLVPQWANSFRELYPNAKLLIATKEDLEKDNREKFVSKVAMGDWDSVIIAQSSFAKINISPERQIQKIEEEIQAIEESIYDSDAPSGSVKNLERIKKGREAQLKRLLDDNRKDNVLIFEKLGVGYLFVDEADAYKNLFLYTKMNNVAGISNAASARASDLQLKIEYINELHDADKGVVFATGTPISNSMTEMYTMQTYLQKRTLEGLGITYFDGWAADFGEAVTALELAPSGKGYRAKTRFAKFTNLPELLTLYHSFADVKTDIKLNTPDVERRIITIKPSDTVIELTEQIAERADRIYAGGVDPRSDNMLKVTGDGKKLALDPRCLDIMAADEKESKLNHCAENVFSEWNNSHEIKGTQLIFCDISTPKNAYRDYEYGEDFDAYNDLKYKLIERGIPENEIAFIHEAKTDKQKQSLFDSVTAGTVRVLMGSTEKCGAGTNVQKRIVALHHLDAPYRPRDFTQRNGRGERQGNMNESIRIYTYAEERTFDSYSYQILENKQRFISQIEKGDMTVREADDIDEATLSYAEIKAITSANPKIKLKMEKDMEVSRLRELESRYKKDLYALQDKIRKDFPEQIQRQTLYLERIRTDIETIKENYNPDMFSINVGGRIFSEADEDGKKDGGLALMAALESAKVGTVVAEYCGFKISLNPIDLLSNERSVTLAGAGQYKMDIGQSASGNLTRLENFVKEFSDREARAATRLEQLNHDFEVAKEQAQIPFEHKDRLLQLNAELAELNAELDLNRRDEVVIDDEESGDSYMALPTEVPKQTNQQKRRKKPITEQLLNRHRGEQKSNPDTILASYKDGYYEAVDGSADDLSRILELPVNVVNIGGEEVKTISVTSEEFTKATESLEFYGRKISVFDAPAEEKPFIDTTDKISAMEVSVLPDYSVTQEQMHEYGYSWDGMLPVRVRTARQLYNLDVPIYRLDKIDAEGIVKDGDFTDTESLYGIEKPDWERFITSDKGKAYLSLKLAMNKSASQVVGVEMSYLDGRYADAISDYLTEERVPIESYIGADISVPEEMKPMIPDMLDHYLKHFPIDVLYEHYGWDTENILSALAENIEDNELRNATEETVLGILFGEKDLDKELEEAIANMPPEEAEEFLELDTEINYKDIVLLSIESEYRDYFDELRTKTPDEIISQSYKMYVFKELYGILTDDTDYFSDKYFRALYEERGYILNSLYDNFLEANEESIDNYDNSSRFIKGYLEGNYIDIMVEYEKSKAAKEAEKTKQEDKNIMAEKEPKTDYIKANIATDALINKYQMNSVFRMPSSSEYAGYTYSVFNDKIRSSRQITDLQSDSQELCYQLSLRTDSEFILRKNGAEDIILSGTELAEIVGGTTSKDYETQNNSDTKWFMTSVPQDAFRKNYDRSTLFVLPNKNDLGGYSFFIPNAFIEEDKNSSDGRILIRLPEDFTVKAQDRNGENATSITAYDFHQLCDGTTSADYDFSPGGLTQSEEKNDGEWKYISVPKNARIAEYDEVSLFKMPSGEYKDYVYYISNNCIKDNDEKGTVRLSLHENYEVRLSKKDGDGKLTATLTAEELFLEIKGKTEADYDNGYKKPSEESKLVFAETEKNLRRCVPDEMKERPNWVAVRTSWNAEKGKVNKYLINCHTGKFAESDNPETWTDFDSALAYAKKNGCYTIAYALDGKDNIACIDLDRCFENGNPSPIAQELLEKVGKTYCEMSVSGMGLHIFGKTDGMDIRTFSKDGDLEFYQKSQFISMTGDGVSYHRLDSFDEPEIKKILESKCEKRTEWQGIGKGAVGLSSMSDKDVVEKASNAKNGDKFKALYSGQDLQNNHSNSDMSLMNILSYWCNGDKEQMLRIFATSGLYRPNKSPDYYECTAIKAIRDTPRTNTYVPKPPQNTGGGNGKK
ncbi:MAG: DEAD/DEAH box helicase family protein [Clostridia bacterium]|nr:DEAD/DEAH box helicase family protein [Clostridia bacterium]